MNFSTEFWANHKRGARKREEISNFLSQNPSASIEAIAEAVNLSTRQVERHLTTIRLESSKNSIAVASIVVACGLVQVGNWLNPTCLLGNLTLETVADKAEITVENSRKFV